MQTPPAIQEDTGPILSTLGVVNVIIISLIGSFRVFVELLSFTCSMHGAQGIRFYHKVCKMGGDQHDHISDVKFLPVA